MKAVKNRKRSKLWAAICAASAIALAIACIALVNCSAGPEPTGNAASASERSAPARATEADEESSEAPEGSDSDSSDPATASEQQSDQFMASTGKTASQDALSGVSGSDSQTYPSAVEAPPATAPAASGGESRRQPVWVVDYEEVWVEDEPEWDESVPVYGSTEVSVCNICGADITGNTAAHGKQHMLAGEGSGHHSEVREAIIGYETVHHPAEGHWERVESGGHWE